MSKSVGQDIKQTLPCQVQNLCNVWVYVWIEQVINQRIHSERVGMLMEFLLCDWWWTGQWDLPGSSVVALHSSCFLAYLDTSWRVFGSGGFLDYHSARSGFILDCTAAETIQLMIPSNLHLTYHSSRSKKDMHKDSSQCCICKQYLPHAVNRISCAMPSFLSYLRNTCTFSFLCLFVCSSQAIVSELLFFKHTMVSL